MLRLRPNGSVTDINVEDNLVTDGSRKYTETANTGDTTGLFNLALPGGGNEGISAWCAACHNYYFEGQATDNDDVARANPFTATYWDTDNDGVAEPTYMHAVDADLMYLPRNGGAVSDLSAHLTASKLPVADDGLVTPAVYDEDDMVTCLTCHRAHGTNATTSSYAALSRTLQSPDFGGNPRPDVVIEGANASVLLRLPDRGVCENCHDMSAGI
jgi:cytochrome c553